MSALPQPTAPPPASVDSPGRLGVPLLRFYLLSVATLGVYAAVTAYRLAARLEPEAGRLRRWLWALAVYFPPAAAALLYEVTRLSQQRLAALGIRPVARSLWLAPVLYLGGWLFLLFSSANALFFTMTLLLPLPALLGLLALNDLDAVLAGQAGLVRAPAPRIELWLGALAVPLCLLLHVVVDAGPLRSLRATRRVAAGEVFTLPSGEFQLTVAKDDWQTTSAQDLGDTTASLALRTRDQRGWLIVFGKDPASTTLDSIVAGRRAVFDEEGHAAWGFHEIRELLADEELTPVSLATYLVSHRDSRRPAATYLVKTIVTERSAFEIVAYAGPHTDVRDQIMSLLSGLRLAPKSGAPAVQR